MKSYYDARAREYERIYDTDDPVRKGELEAIEARLGTLVRGRSVLEIACGTGFWTERMAKLARVTAVDAAPETLAVARAKDMGPSVALVEGDAYRLADVPGSFDAAVANFWLSHVPRARLRSFLAALHARLEPGAAVFLMDNVFVEGRGGDLVTREGEADTYKRRVLDDGSVHEVLKNYFGEGELRALVEGRATGLSIHVGRCYWWLDYRLEGDTPGPA